MPKLNYFAERSLNYGLTFRQMQEHPETLELLFELLARIQYIARQSKTIWDIPVFPTAFFKRSRAVSAYMIDRVDRILTNLFGREWTWWDKWTSASDDYDPFGNAKKAIPKGLARETAQQRVDAIEAKLDRQKVPLAEFTSAQSHPGLTYDPTLLSEANRVMSGEEYDRLANQERQADLKRAQIEYAIVKERSELLVPLVSTQATSQAVSTPQPNPTPQS